MSRSDDPFGLARFVEAQADDYAPALAELCAGEKRSHWMWYVFPQIDGLGQSPTSRRYSLKSAAEAKAYLDHPVLGSAAPRVLRSGVRHRGTLGAREIFGSPDDMKLRSSATLFASVSGDNVFARVLEKYFDGKLDEEAMLTSLRRP